MQLDQFNVNITNAANVKTTVRSMTQNMDERNIEVYIREAQLQDIRRGLGDNLFIDVMKYINRTEKPDNQAYETLLNGGIYNYCDQEYCFAGVVNALNYYVLAKIIRHGDFKLTNAGARFKDAEYSTRPDEKARNNEYADAINMAEEFLQDCIRFIKHNKSDFPKFFGKRKTNRGCLISKIGD